MSRGIPRNILPLLFLALLVSSSLLPVILAKKNSGTGSGSGNGSTGSGTKKKIQKDVGAESSENSCKTACTYCCLDGVCAPDANDCGGSNVLELVLVVASILSLAACVCVFNHCYRQYKKSWLEDKAHRHMDKLEVEMRNINFVISEDDLPRRELYR
mmetsp:Transcript_7572/g.8266  ORF Transcript_7572/g.8266 Transcript_7572/m.8266 type:complete len:157 (+) Transcript_7572:34-504(+)